MTNDTRTPDDIERDIADERAQMSATINDLQKKFSVDAILGDLGSMLRTQGGDLGRAVIQTVGRNPAAVALIGVGLVWLLTGQDRNRSKDPEDDPWGAASTDNRNRPTYDAWDRNAARSGRSSREASGDADPYWYGHGHAAQARQGQGRNPSGKGQSGAQTVGTSGNVQGAIFGAASAIGHAVSGAAENAGHAASDLKDRLSHGLEDFSEDARSRVLAARHAAQEARLASAAGMKKGARAASNFFKDQPLIVGALAVAMGAALAGLLPQTRIEDNVPGDSSDKLFAKAQAIYREERDKAMNAARMASSDVKDELRNAGSDLADLLPEGRTVGDVGVDRATEAAVRA